MQPVEFEVSYVSEKMHRRFVRYHAWWRYHPAIIGLTIVLLLVLLAYMVTEIILGNASFGLGPFWILYMLLFIPHLQNDSYNKFFRMRWEYAFRESDFVARTYEAYHAWKYSALRYAHEAKDAFYLAFDGNVSPAMIIPKEELTPKTSSMLADVLQKSVPEGKYTRAGTRARGNRQNTVLGACALGVAICIIAGLTSMNIANNREATTEPTFTFPHQEYTTQQVTMPALRKAEAGDRLIFGRKPWIVLEKRPTELLLIIEDAIEIFRGNDDELLVRLNNELNFGDKIFLGNLLFTAEEFDHIRKSSDDNYLFLLSPEEMAAYGIELPEDDGSALMPVKPAVWVSIDSPY